MRVRVRVSLIWVRVRKLYFDQDEPAKLAGEGGGERSTHRVA